MACADSTGYWCTTSWRHGGAIPIPEARPDKPHIPHNLKPLTNEAEHKGAAVGLRGVHRLELIDIVVVVG